MKTFAQVISFIFHPLIIVTYMLILLLLVDPYLFSVHHISMRIPLILMLFFSTFAIPALSVLMMKLLGLIDSFQMHDKLERTGPYISTGILYMWMAFFCYNSEHFPLEFTIAIVGATIALFVAFIINIFQKISIHAVGMGGFIAMVLLLMLEPKYAQFSFGLGNLGIFQTSMTTIFMLVLLLAGIVGTARLMLGAHEPKELYGGYVVGFLSQFIAFVFLVG